jgi:hypothetical protein
MASRKAIDAARRMGSKYAEGGGFAMPANRGAPAIPEAACAFRGSELCRMLPQALPLTGRAPIGSLENARSYGLF